MQILIAKDSAFNFIYRANIDELSELGEITYFSPINDKTLPPCDLLYLPGGYPELFFSEIKRNHSICQQVKDYAEQGGRIFAECGGFMYLCHDIDGESMCDVFPFHATMKDAHLHLGYREMNGMKGHEFHYSSIEEMQSEECRMKVPSVYRYKNVIAGYTHWYWAETGFETLWNKLLQNAFDNYSKKQEL